MESIPDVLGPVSSLLMLLPGFVTLFVERALAYQRDSSGVAVVAKALVYSLFTYVLFSLTGMSLLTWDIADVAGGRHRLLLLPDPWGALSIVLISVGLGLVVGIVKTHDLQMAVARRLGMSSRTCREGIWLDVLHGIYLGGSWKGWDYDPTKPSIYACVHLTDGRRIIGWPVYTSDEYQDGPVVFLTNAAWVGDEGIVPIPDPGILVNGLRVEFVQFYTRDAEEHQDEREWEE